MTDKLNRNINLPAVVESELCANESEVPDLVRIAGNSARFAWDEFVYGRIRNRHTRRNYVHAIRLFLRWCDHRGLGLPRISPKDVGQYLDGLCYATATKKLHLAALRHFFDELVTRHVVLLNPAASVRGERLQVLEGKTPEITAGQVRQLLSSIDTTNLVGIRDRAVIGVLLYTAARVGAVARLRRGHFVDSGHQYCLRLQEKAGKQREIPVRHDLQQDIHAYLNTAGLADSDRASPLFRTTTRRTKLLTNNAMTAGDIARMIKRRLRRASLPTHISPHSFRVATITNLLSQGVSLEDVQHLAGHADPRTTRLYDRRHRQVTRNIVERISL
jgi:site-specific recombinase XerD